MFFATDKKSRLKSGIRTLHDLSRRSVVLKRRTKSVYSHDTDVETKLGKLNCIMSILHFDRVSALRALLMMHVPFNMTDVQ